MDNEKEMKDLGYRKSSKRSLLDRDNIDLFMVDDDNQQIITEVLLEDNESSDLQSWQEEILLKEDFVLKERKFYGVAKVKKAELVCPSESQLMSYYMDYGYKNIDAVLDEYGEVEMLREWYINTTTTSMSVDNSASTGIHPIDWDSEYEQIDVIDQSDWQELYDLHYD